MSLVVTRQRVKGGHVGGRHIRRQFEKTPKRAREVLYGPCATNNGSDKGESLPIVSGTRNVGSPLSLGNLQDTLQ